MKEMLLSPIVALIAALAVAAPAICASAWSSKISRDEERAAREAGDPEAAIRNAGVRQLAWYKARDRNGEWHEGYPTVCKFKGHWEVHITTLAADGSIGTIWRALLPTICEFTGKQSRQGVRIFEHDVVRWDGRMWEVLLRHGSWSLVSLTEDDWEFLCSCAGECEITGNTRNIMGNTRNGVKACV